jgi:hypothetical protein
VRAVDFPPIGFILTPKAVSFAPTGLGQLASLFPRLAPWAAFLRRYAAAVSLTPSSVLCVASPVRSWLHELEAGAGGAPFPVGVRSLAASRLCFRQGHKGAVLCPHGCAMLRRHSYVDIFEDSTGRDTECAIGGLDQVVSLASAVVTAERIDEAEVGVELFCFYQKASAIGFPFHGGSHVCPSRGRGFEIFDC